jgi:hypothetical protein
MIESCHENVESAELKEEVKTEFQIAITSRHL